MLTELGTWGVRARPLNADLREQVLILGLGEVGLQAIAKLHQLLEQTIPPRQRQEHLRLFAIAGRKSIKQEQLLPRENRLLLKLDPVRWSDVPGRFSGIGVARWWARTPNQPTLQADPTPTRPYGRLLLWNNVEILSEALFDLADWLKTSSEYQKAPRRILILASAAEPEGSGMLFDVVGRLRLLLQSFPTAIVGVLTADSSFENEEERLRSMATVYATLKEIDATCNQPEIYQHELPRIRRSQNLPIHITQGAFDHICLTGDTAQPIEDPEGALIEFTQTWLLSLLNTQPAVPFLPIPTHMTEKAIIYTAFGMAKLALPVKDALNFHLIGIAKTVLTSLLIPYPESVEAWVQKVIARVHNDLMTQNLLEHHSLGDKVHELYRRVAPTQLSTRYKRTTQIAGAWQAIVNSEWAFLQRENQPTEVDKDGIQIPRDVLRRRMDNALEEGLRPLLHDIEALAVNLAYGEGWGLKWTHRAFEMLCQQIAQALDKIQARCTSTHKDLDRTAQQWLTMGNARQFNNMDKVVEELLTGLQQWIGWEARLAVWEELLKHTKDIRDRLDLALQQIPLELTQLTQTGKELEAKLGQAMNLKGAAGSPVTKVASDFWLESGVGAIPPANQVPPHDLVASVFKRWDPTDTPPIRQLQKFPQEVLNATRLTLQPYANFSNIYDFMTQQLDPTMLQPLTVRMGQRAAPTWTITAVTDRLDKPFIQPLAIELVREVPRNFSLIPKPTQDRVLRMNLPSPDPDEVVVIRMTHGWSPEHVQKLRNEYRRAYYRVSSDNVPLHIDRRWETTMADLVHTTLRTEISDLWDAAVKTNHKGARYSQDSVLKLSNALATALEVPPERIQRLNSPVEDILLHIYPLQPFRLKIPPPACTFAFMLSHRPTSDVAEDLFRCISSNMPEENFFFLINVAERGDLSRILESLHAQGFLPLALNEADIKHIISAPKPSNALRDTVIERIDLSAVSPFYTRAPVPDHMFFGREKEVADVRSKLNTHSVVLIGGRRIGKTSTLQKINRTLKHPESPLIPYYLDCSNILKHRHFFRRISQEWRIDVDDPDDPVEFDVVVNILQKRHLLQTPVFLLDEVDRLLKTDQATDFDEPLFRTFRTLSNEKRCQFVFSGEKLLLGSLSNARSVLFNFPQKVKLSPLSKEVVQRLVTEPFEMLNIWLEDVDDLIQRIYEISAGHPNIVQTICHALVDAVDKQKDTNLLTRQHLGTVLDWHPLQADVVETIWGQMDPLAKLVTLIWPENTRRMTLEDIQNLIRKVGVTQIMTQQVKDIVIPDLILYNFLQQDGQQYTLIPVLFPTILDEMTNKRMEIRAIVEEYQG